MKIDGNANNFSNGLICEQSLMMHLSCIPLSSCLLRCGASFCSLGSCFLGVDLLSSAEKEADQLTATQSMYASYVDSIHTLTVYLHCLLYKSPLPQFSKEYPYYDASIDLCSGYMLSIFFELSPWTQTAADYTFYSCWRIDISWLQHYNLFYVCCRFFHILQISRSHSLSFGWSSMCKFIFEMFQRRFHSQLAHCFSLPQNMGD